MYHYRAYGMTVATEFELPELATAARETADIVIEQQSLERVTETATGAEGRHIEAESDSCRLTYDGVGTFEVQAGDRIACDPLSEAVVEQDAFRRLLENELFGVALYQRGYLVLHGSAVAVDGQGRVFLGPQGAGKSTVAAALHQDGHTLLEDDVVGIRVDTDPPTVLPGVPQLRVRSDAAAALDLTDQSTPAGASWYDKRFLDIESPQNPVPLDRCYVLRQGDSVAETDYTGQDTLLELVRHTYARGLLTETSQMPEHFEQCAQLAAQCDFRVLRVPNDLSALSDVVATVTKPTSEAGSDR
jgi:hypothetical protein